VAGAQPFDGTDECTDEYTDNRTECERTEVNISEGSKRVGSGPAGKTAEETRASKQDESFAREFHNSYQLSGISF
jgi:hypothetical protein